MPRNYCNYGWREGLWNLVSVSDDFHEACVFWNNAHIVLISSVSSDSWEIFVKLIAEKILFLMYLYMLHVSTWNRIRPHTCLPFQKLIHSRYRSNNIDNLASITKVLRTSYLWRENVLGQDFIEIVRLFHLIFLRKVLVVQFLFYSFNSFLYLFMYLFEKVRQLNHNYPQNSSSWWCKIMDYLFSFEQFIYATVHYCVFFTINIHIRKIYCHFFLRPISFRN